MRKMEQAWKELCEISAQIRKLQELSSIAAYDMVATAAPGAAVRRGQLQRFAGEQSRKLLLSERTKELVNFLARKKENLSDVMQGEIREYQRRFYQVEGIPSELLGELASLSSETEQLWIRVRHTGPYEELLTNIGRIVEMKKEIAKARQEYRKEEAPAHPLDSIIHGTDPGLTVARLTELFEEVKATILPLLAAIREKGTDLGAEKIQRPLSLERQHDLCVKLLEQMGYDPQYGVIGTGEHPCTYGINRHDVRFTNHFYPENLLTALKSATHEGGHGMYAMGTMQEYEDMLIGSPISGSIHESSSRFWEIMVAHSEPFWEFALPFIQKECPGVMDDLTPQDCWRGMNQVNPGPVRIRADELTYNLHIMLRFEMERELFDGSLRACDIPEAWNERSRNWLGVIPESAAFGWAQDMHWPAGMFGYFQSYSMGNLYSAQVEATMREQLPNMDEDIRQGNFAFIREWLTEHWYRFGHIYSGEELMKRVNGKPLSASFLCTHLEEKYKKLYELS